MSLHKDPKLGKLGLGKLGSTHVKFIRKWYWSLQVNIADDEIHLPKIRVSNRPSEEKDTITTTIFDWEDSHDVQKLWELFGCNAKSPFSWPPEQKGTGILRLLLPDHANFTEDTHLSNCPMKPFEQWTLSDLEMVAVNFNDLDHSNTSPVELELTWKYSKVIYKNLDESGLNTDDELLRTRPENPDS